MRSSASTDDGDFVAYYLVPFHNRCICRCACASARTDGRIPLTPSYTAYNGENENVTQDHASAYVNPFPPHSLDRASLHCECRYRAQTPTKPLLYRVERITGHSAAFRTRSSLRSENTGDEKCCDDIGNEGPDRESVDERGACIESGEEESEDSARRSEEDRESGAMSPRRRRKEIEEESDEVR